MNIFAVISLKANLSLDTVVKLGNKFGLIAGDVLKLKIITQSKTEKEGSIFIYM